MDEGGEPPGAAVIRVFIVYGEGVPRDECVQKAVERRVPGGCLAAGRREFADERCAVAGKRRFAPAAAQGFTQVYGDDFAKGVEIAARGVGVVKEIAGVEEVVLAEESGLGTDGAFDERTDASMVGRQPCDDMACARPWVDGQHDAFCLDDLSCHGGYYTTFGR